jgi:plastocyanin
MRQAGKVAPALCVVALAGAAALPLGGASADTTPKPKTITLKDSFYSPSSLKVKKGGKVVWRWSNANTQTHNVTLKTAPPGVKKSKFDSNDASSHFTFKTTFTKPGKYHFECTIHPTTMQADIKVKSG